MVIKLVVININQSEKYSLNMQPSKIDSVHDYLTPKKILNSLIVSNKNSSKLNRSYTEQIANQNQIEQSSREKTVVSKNQSNVYKKKQPMNEDIDRDNNFILQQDKYTQNKTYNGNGDDFIKVSDQRLPMKATDTKSEYVASSRVKKQYPQQNSSSNRKFGLNSKAGNPQISKLAIQDTLNKLVLTKNALQYEIAELKKLLDDVQESLQNMDIEYQKFKQKILFFTSKTLDAAYCEYKKNLPDWVIYEEIENKGLQKLQEINKLIQICENQGRLKVHGGKESIEKNIPQLQKVVQQVKQVKTECSKQRPFITEEKLKKLESVLKQIGQF